MSIFSYLKYQISDPQPGPFKLFVEIETKNDEYESFYVMQAVCIVLFLRGLMTQ